MRSNTASRLTYFSRKFRGKAALTRISGHRTAGAEGIAQFKPATAASLGIDPLDPAQALQGAAEYDAQLYQQNGNSWVGALSSYSGGLTPANPGNPNYATAFADAETADAGGTATASAGDYGLSVSTTDGPATTAAAGATTTPRKRHDNDRGEHRCGRLAQSASL